MLVELAGAPDGTLWLTTGDQYVTQFTPPANVARLKVSNANAYSSGLYIDADGVVYVSDRTESQLAKIVLAISTTTDTMVRRIPQLHAQPLLHHRERGRSDRHRPGHRRAWMVADRPDMEGVIQGTHSRAAEVCRFYGAIDINPATGSRRGPNSHFYTSEPAECASVKLDAGWTYEALAKFWVIKARRILSPAVPRGRSRSIATQQPLHVQRFDHRYSVDVAIYNQMLALGWSGEAW